MTAKRLSKPTAEYYYEYVPTVSHLVSYVQESVCPKDVRQCPEKARSLLSADCVDIDYDAVSQSFVVTSLWHSPPDSQTWNERVSRPNNEAKVEIGVLKQEKAITEGELTFGGYLITLGEDKKPSKLPKALFATTL